MSKVKVRIIEMEHHFLYLPVYFARARNFFGHVSDQYETAIVQAAAGTDADTYQRLIRGQADLAICDPCALIYGGVPSFPVRVLAGLVIRGAFWAVNTNSPVSELEDLAQFQHIIAFHPGTTSHGIAKRISRSARGATPIIEPVRPLQELTKLEELIEEKKNAVALSPDVLRIERSIEANSEWLRVKFSLADTVEYGHLLITAVMARADFAERHTGFVQGFLKALQRSLVHAAAEDPALVAYGCDAFNQPAHIVERALKRGNASQVWAPSLAVSEDLWLNAVDAHYDSIGQAFDAAAKKEAQRIFAESFKPEVEPAQRAALDLIREGGVPANIARRDFLVAGLSVIGGVASLRL